jgi:hypothetical protein
MTNDRDAAERAAYEATDNPLHVWFAIGRYAVDEPLPDWIRRYLAQCTRELLRLSLNTSISPTEAAAQTARALGLVSGQGSNAFLAARQLREDSFIATLYTMGAPKGASEWWAAELADARGGKPGISHESKVRKILRIVQKMKRTWGR